MIDDQASDSDKVGALVPEDIVAIPVAHRRILARWIAQRAALPSGDQVPEDGATGRNEALVRAAVSLVDPLTDMPTADHVSSVLASLALDGPHVDRHQAPTGIVSIGSTSYVDMSYYIAALDEIYALRAALAEEGRRLSEELQLKTYPTGARRRSAEAVTRMRAAARGDCAKAYKALGLDSRAALRTAGAPEGFTHADWKPRVDQAHAEESV